MPLLRGGGTFCMKKERKFPEGTSETVNCFSHATD